MLKKLKMSRVIATTLVIATAAFASGCASTPGSKRAVNTLLDSVAAGISSGMSSRRYKRTYRGSIRHYDGSVTRWKSTYRPGRMTRKSYNSKRGYTYSRIRTRRY